MIEYIFLKIVFMSLGMSAAGILLWCGLRLFSKVLTKKICYFMWLTVLVFSFVPVAGIPREKKQYQNDVYTAPAEFKQEDNNMQFAADDIGAVQNTLTEGTADNIGNTPVQLPSVPKTDISYIEIISIAYFFSIILLAAVYFIKSLKFKVMLNRRIILCDTELLTECKNKIGLRKKVKVYSVPAVCSPFVYGAVKTKVIIPNGQISYEAMLHEVIHISHRDTLWLSVLNVVKIMHFFNPFIYIFSAQIKKYMEFACDESVSGLLDAEQRLLYSKSIIEYSSPLAKGTACLSESGKNIKERIDFIMTKNKRSGKVKILSAVFIAAVIACQTVFAAAVNENAPVKSYIINNAREIYGVMYKTGEEWSYSQKSGRLQNRASLVNTEIYKGFSADLKLQFAKGKGVVADKDNIKDADMRIEMDSFLKAFDNGKVWQGLFTVTMDGEIILSKANGYINNVPGKGNRDFTGVYIENESKDVSVNIEHIDFGVAPDSVINAEYEEEQLKDFEASFERYTLGSVSANYKYNNKIYSAPENGLRLFIKANPEKGKFFCSGFYLEGAKVYIVSMPGEKYIFDNDTVTGRFLIKKDGDIVIDEIEASLSGISGSSITLKSADGSTAIDMQADDSEETKEFYSRNTLVRDDRSDFENTCTKNIYARRLDDLPFTLTLDSGKIILKIKDGFSPDAWYYSYASYIGENDVYNKYHSKYGGNQTVLDISPSYGTYNLQFNYYNVSPCVYKGNYDILFRIVNDEIIYYSCKEYVIENDKYSGAEGEEMINKYLVSWTFPDIEE